MKKIGIMQPYLFPYIGYWQLLYAVDRYVVLDDVNYIVRGYINRNHILVNGEKHRFSVPVRQASQNKRICETKLNFTDKDKNRLLDTLRFAYAKAPCFEQAFPVIRDILLNEEDDLTRYILCSIDRIKEYLGIETPVIRSSEIAKDPAAHGQDRILAVCRALGADTYINPSGGRALYEHDRFERENIRLLFLDPCMEKIRYPQFQNEFVGSLSIIDLMMFNDVPALRRFLSLFELNEK